MNNIKTGLSYIENFGCKIENVIRVESSTETNNSYCSILK